MFDAETIAQINGQYKMPEDAGPAWREAVRMGMDMTLIECNLEMTPWERLLQNDSFLRLVHQLRQGRPVNDGASNGDN